MVTDVSITEGERTGNTAGVSNTAGAILLEFPTWQGRYCWSFKHGRGDTAGVFNSSSV
jgi:hypothetical protein